jgi:hypothetical protein
MRFQASLSWDSRLGIDLADNTAPCSSNRYIARLGRPDAGGPLLH